MKELRLVREAEITINGEAKLRFSLVFDDKILAELRIVEPGYAGWRPYMDAGQYLGVPVEVLREVVKSFRLPDGVRPGTNEWFLANSREAVREMTEMPLTSLRETLGAWQETQRRAGFNAWLYKKMVWKIT